MADTRWLEQRGRGWYAVKEVPRPLQSAIGRRRFIKSLKTRDVHVAIARRHAALAEFERILAAARARGKDAPLMQAAAIWRDTFAGIGRNDPAPIADWETWETVETDDGEVVVIETAHFNASEVFHGELASIRAQHGEPAAKGFHDLAKGLATPLLHYVDPWLAEGGVKGPLRGRTKRQYHSDVAELGAWAEANGIPALLESITKPVAGRYVTEALLGQGVNRKTANRKISALSAYWRWLLKRTAFTMNPWSGQSFPKGSASVGGRRYKRPFTEAEVVTLLNGPADPELADAMRIAALSGMRVEEAYKLTVADCTGGWFNVRDAKTRAGIRRVPIHPDLAVILARRTTGKPDAAFLFPEPGELRAGRERSMALSKRFGNYRDRLGLTERPDGQRQASADFHSWRRWFITQARAGFDRAVVAAIVGHKTGNITDDVYSGGPNDDRRQACVEAVRLPPDVGAYAPPPGTAKPTRTPPRTRNRQATAPVSAPRRTAKT